MLIADRMLLTRVSWRDLDAAGYVFGTHVSIDATSYRCRLLSGGDRPCDDPFQGAGPTSGTRWWVAHATLAAGGGEVASPTPGDYFAPMLFIGVDSGAPVARDEIFGPIAAVLRAPDLETALATANDTEFGLSAGIVSQNGDRIDHFAEHAEAGMIQINLPTAGMEFHAPFTGRKGSSHGAPEKGSYCREFFNTARVVHATRGRR